MEIHNQTQNSNAFVVEQKKKLILNEYMFSIPITSITSFPPDGRGFLLNSKSSRPNSLIFGAAARFQ